MDSLKQALSLLPEHFKPNIGLPSDINVEEIRLRCGRYPTVLVRGESIPFSKEYVKEEDLQRIIEKATGASMHVAIGSIREGYLCFHGLRIGVCGTAVLQRGKLEAIRSISSVNIRIPGDYPGISNFLMSALMNPQFQNTLILSPPGAGKTTLLRDIIRQLSLHENRIAVIDERNEISGRDSSWSGFDLGPQTDVLIGTDKAKGAMMLLRCMNPQIIAMDEISCEKDILAVEKMIGCGVGILATAHAKDRSDFIHRPIYNKLLERNAFTFLVIIHIVDGKRRYLIERIAE